MYTFEFDRYRFDPADGRLTERSGEAEVHLRPQASRLMEHLVENPSAVIDRETLIRIVWGEDAVVDFEAGLAALMRELRQALQKLGGDPQLIETVPRRGYRLRSEVKRVSRREPERPVQARRPRTFLFTAALAVGFGIVAMVLVAAFSERSSFKLFGLFESKPQAASGTPSSRTDRVHALAILPIERFGAEADPPARAGILLADQLLAELWQAELDNLELIGRAGMRPYAGREDVSAAVARDLGVDLLIEGSLRVDAGQWRVDVRLLSLPPGRVVWSQTISGDEASLPTTRIATELVEQLRRDWPEMLATLDQSPGRDNTAR